jgi:RNA polymerase sigma factor (sigma-70 family)
MSDGTVFVIDDDPAIRDSLGLLLGLHGMRSRMFASAESFLAAYDPAEGGCALIDIRMSGMDGLALHGQILGRGWTLPCIMMSAYGDVATTRAALKAGALDFLEKPLDDEVLLLDVVRNALSVDEARRQSNARLRDVHERFGRLTGREREVMQRLADGLSNRQIAESLQISPRTVEVYKARLYEKLQIRTNSDLVKLALELARESAPP